MKNEPKTMSLVLHFVFAATALTVAFLVWYLLVLLRRTSFLAHATSIGSDVIIGFHVIGILAVSVSIFLKRHLKLKYGWPLSIVAISNETAFFLLNWFGYVWEYQKEAPESLHAAIVKLMSEMLK